ncbi:WhiB family transcriptional regulator [Roseateles sp.]|uniref:WhiB family transcriptional regulator n=1 Tax=Roseateles sp. TaxID=1971397 RepID=UPI002F40436E
MTRRAAAPTIASDKPETWQEQSVCREVDAELFYPLGGEGEHRRTGFNLVQELEAKKVCARCPVSRECLEYALGAGDPWGIWGGLNEAERRDLLKRRSRDARAA